MRSLQAQLVEKAIANSEDYRRYQYVDEWDDPALHDKAFEWLDSNPVQFVELWNDKQSYNGQVNASSFENSEELADFMRELILNYPMILEEELTEVLKNMFIRWFEKESHTHAQTEVRAQALTHIFTNGQQQNRQPEQCCLF